MDLPVRFWACRLVSVTGEAYYLLNKDIIQQIMGFRIRLRLDRVIQAVRVRGQR